MKPRPYEAILAAFSLACVMVFGLDRLGWLLSAGLAGSLPLGLYPLYSLAAASGWLQGNLYSRRAGSADRNIRPVLFAFYLLVPVGPLFMFRAMAPLAAQQSAPLVPWFCAGIVAVFFFVPVSLRPRTPARRPRIGQTEEEKERDSVGEGKSRDPKDGD